MEQALSAIRSGQVREGMQMIIDFSRQLRADLPAIEWKKTAASYFLSHPVKEICWLCPFTSRSYRKPRGYPGDAVILDYIYGIRTPDAVPPSEDSLASKVYDYTSNSPASRAVRYRRSLLAIMADEAARKFHRPRILSIAAGHLREIELSAAARDGAIAEWRALDQDPLSLEEISRSYLHLGARPVKGSVRSLIAKPLAQKFDLVYAAGLFDYLQRPVAVALARRMVEMTAPGGTVLIANFLPGIADVGYMETFMDWHLIFRSREEVAEIMREASGDAISDLSVFTDPDENIAFARAVVKA